MDERKGDKEVSVQRPDDCGKPNFPHEILGVGQIKVDF